MSMSDPMHVGPEHFCAFVEMTDLVITQEREVSWTPDRVNDDRAWRCTSARDQSPQQKLNRPLLLVLNEKDKQSCKLSSSHLVDFESKVTSLRNFRRVRHRMFAKVRPTSERPRVFHQLNLRSFLILLFHT